MYRNGDLARGIALMSSLTAFVMATGSAGADVFVAQVKPEKKPRSPQEQRRRKLLEEMGLHAPSTPRTPTPSASPSPSSSSPNEAVVPVPGPGKGAKPGEPNAPKAQDEAPGTSRDPQPAALPAAPSFRKVIHPLLVQTCKACHVAGGPAGLTSFVLAGDAGLDRAATERMVDLGAPAASALLAKASGQKPHAGGAPWPVGGIAYGRALAWIQAGARLDGAPRSPPNPLPVTPIVASQATGGARGSRAGNARALPIAPALATGTAATAQGESTTTAQGADQETRTPAPSTDESADAATADDATADTAAGNRLKAQAQASDFATKIHPLLMHTCAACHSPVGPAAPTRLVLSGEVNGDYAKVRALVNPSAPAQSLLISKSIGQGHAGGAVIAVRSTEYQGLVNWVANGASSHAAIPAVAQSGLSPGATAEILDTTADGILPLPETPVPGTATGTGQAGDTTTSTGPTPPLRTVLPYGLALNGRFDLAYERRGFSGNPLGDGAVNALRSYHHFLFLSRDSTDDPIGLAVEVLSLEFWEAHFRWRAKDAPIQIAIAAGKLVVPFGADPLMHQSYGGLAGFDQRILPPIWAEHGLAVHVVAHHRELALTDDIYVVRGYALRQADAVINLQNDFSPEDDSHLGWGNRLGAAWGPLSGWHSIYYNTLGFGRRLVMQAADVMLARVREIPVLGHFSFAAGLMRADVSGGDGIGTGGAGKDYYHFGSYVQVRYHMTDSCYLQYRQGLRTFNNRRGLIVDDTRLTRDDGSTHNFGAVARYRGLTAGLYYFINLEKVDEIPDDFLRASVTYDF